MYQKRVTTLTPELTLCIARVSIDNTRVDLPSYERLNDWKFLTRILSFGSARHHFVLHFQYRSKQGNQTSILEGSILILSLRQRYILHSASPDYIRQKTNSKASARPWYELILLRTVKTEDTHTSLAHHIINVSRYIKEEIQYGSILSVSQNSRNFLVSYVPLHSPLCFNPHVSVHYTDIWKATAKRQR